MSLIISKIKEIRLPWTVPKHCLAPKPHMSVLLSPGNKTNSY